MAIVTYVLGDCPGCAARASFGNVEVFGTHIYKGCKRCRYHQRIPLPEIRKRIVYLDQFFFSHAFRENDARFMDAAERIKNLCSLQLLAAPYSTIHEDETHQWHRRQELFDFIKATSRGAEFEPAYDVERLQLEKAFASLLRGEPPTYREERVDALPDDIDEWDSYMRIDVGRYIGDIDLIRDLKRQSIEGLVSLFPGWRAHPQSFDADLAAEYQAAGRGYMQFFVEYVARIARGDYAAFIDAPLASMVVQSLLHVIPQSIPEDQHLAQVAQFLSSEHFKVTPYQWLNAHILATLKAIVKDGAYANREQALRRLSGFFFDVKHVATYAPYVDAFVVDQPMAELVNRPTVALENRYGTKIFSLNNWNDFLVWLDEIKAAGMTDIHKEALRAAYPRLPVE